MLWEIRGTRDGKPIRAKVSASSEESARRKAEAGGVTVRTVLPMEDQPAAAPATPETPKSARPQKEASTASGSAPAAPRYAPAPEPEIPPEEEPEESPVADQDPTPIDRARNRFVLNDEPAAAPAAPSFKPPATTSFQPPATPAMPSAAAPSSVPPLPVVKAPKPPAPKKPDATNRNLFLALASIGLGVLAVVLMWLPWIATRFVERQEGNRITAIVLMWLPWIAMGIGAVGLAVGIGVVVITRQLSNKENRNYALAGAGVSLLAALSGLLWLLKHPTAVAEVPKNHIQTAGLHSPKQVEQSEKLRLLHESWKSTGFFDKSLLQTLNGSNFTKSDGGIEFQNNGEANCTETVDNSSHIASYRLPLNVKLVVKARGKEFRVIYGSKSISFNSQVNSDGAHVNGGDLPFDNWAAIEIAVRPNEMNVYVDGKIKSTGDFSGVSGSLTIQAPAGGVRLQALDVARPR